MKIAVPTEIKPREGRVVLVPDAVAQLISYGHEVFIQAGAGLLSGYSNEQYELQGAAAHLAVGLRTEVVVFDRNRDKNGRDACSGA